MGGRADGRTGGRADGRTGRNARGALAVGRSHPDDGASHAHRSSLLLPALALSAFLAGGAPAAYAQGAVADHMTPSREDDQERLGAAGLQKCAAYKHVRTHSAALQAADHGDLTPADRRRLDVELARARDLPPTRLTPADCGVAL
jgi:hypothetical protein